MIIVFICGSLEQGKDGVGDYVRRLAGELINQGHQAAAIALNDQYLKEEIDDYQFAEQRRLPVLRLPAAWPENIRFKRAKYWLDRHNPDWLSLQFVPFSFHSKGLPVNLKKKLYFLGKGRRWHVMLHELWVGMDTNASLKLVCWGKIQQYLLKKMLTGLMPDLMHTQTTLYQQKLFKLGFSVKYLPLFSNIPVVYNHDLDLNKALDSTPAKSKKEIIFVLFGNAHPGAPVEQFSEEAARYATENDVRFVLKIVGKPCQEHMHWASAWSAVGLEVEVLGEQSIDSVSRILLTSSYGIVTTPIALLEKSGVFAAMLEHGLRVIAVSKPWKPRGEHFELKNPNGVVGYSRGNFKNCIEFNYSDFSSKTKLSQVYLQFIENLSETVI